MGIEIWEAIKGYEGRYEISNMGDIKSIINNNSLLLKQQISEYNTILLYNEYGLRKRMYIHRLVAIAFIENPNKLEIINHINGIKDDNRVENLEWCTQKHNIMEAWKLGKCSSPKYWLGKKGYNNKTSKPVKQIKLDGTIIKEYGSQGQAAEELGLFQSNISYCCQGKYKTCGGFIWEYA